MTETPFTLTIHMVASLDGFIAKDDNSISWFDTNDHYEKGVTPSPGEITDFLKDIDCYIMGRNTYQQALALTKNHGWAYGDKPTIVLTTRSFPSDIPTVTFYAGDVAKLVNEQLKIKYKNVWLVGGADTVRDFLNLKLSDEIRLSVMPIILGKGKLFFTNMEHEQTLHLHNVTAYKSGMVELHYQIKYQ